VSEWGPAEEAAALTVAGMAPAWGQTIHARDWPTPIAPWGHVERGPWAGFALQPPSPWVGATTAAL